MKLRLNLDQRPPQKPVGFGHGLLRFLTSHEETQAPTPGSFEQGKSILLVDDDPIILKTTSAKLAQAGFQVNTAADCAEAISSVADKKPQVIVLDVNFPPDVASGGATSWDGFRLMYWLRSLQNTRDTQFVVISGTDSEEFKDRARSAGALGFLAKPIDHEQLVSTILSNKKPQVSKSQTRRWWVSFFSFV